MSFETAIMGLTGYSLVNPGSIKELGGRIADSLPVVAGCPVLLVHDENVGRFYGTPVLESLVRQRFMVSEVDVPPGEESKTVACATTLYNEAARVGFTRYGLVVAVGGGVVSDLAGFVAATWMRGVRWIACPTTVEAAVDACLGGKTGLNLPNGKNLIGAFHHPSLIVVDPECFRTLESRDVRAGLAESVKHALLSSEEFLSWHEQIAEALLALDMPVMTECVRRNLEFKSAIVVQDPREEKDIRVQLNLGHTIGHAIEAAAGFSLRHGEAIALGLLAACRLSHGEKLLDLSTVTRAQKLLERLGLPTVLDRSLDESRILSAIRLDKKNRDQAVRFVLLEGIGKPVVRVVPIARIAEAVRALY